MAPSSNLSVALKKLNSGLTVLGLTIAENESKRKIFKLRFIYVLNFLWLNIDVLGASVCFINSVMNKSFIEATYIAPCIVFSFLANIRAYTIVHYDKEIKEIIKSLVNLEDRQNKSPQSKEREEIIHRGLYFLNAVIYGTKVFNMALISIFILSPLVLTMVIYLKTNQWNLLLPFLIIYPFDSHDIRYWPFVYIHQIWSEIIVVLSICYTDIFLYICCTFISIQFGLLQHDLRNIFEKQYRDQEEFNEAFKELVKWHQRLISLSKSLDNVYSKSTLFHFVVSSIIICLTGFNVMTFESKMLAGTFLVFLSVNLFQIYFLCYFGDILMRSSVEVSSAVYQSGWYTTSWMVGKNWHIVQARSQKPCKLTAFQFADVNLHAFMSILSTAWSYFALLKTIYKPTRT